MNNGLTIGALIEALKALPADKNVVFDFPHCAPTGIASYRGYYDQAALGWAPTGYSGNHRPPSAGDLVKWLEHAVDDTPYEGWKGGTNYYFRDTALWVDNPGDCSSTCITSVSDDGYYAVLNTVKDEAVVAARDRDAAQRKAAGFEAEGQQPGPSGIATPERTPQ